MAGAEAGSSSDEGLLVDDFANEDEEDGPDWEGPSAAPFGSLDRDDESDEEEAEEVPVKKKRRKDKNMESEDEEFESDDVFDLMGDSSESLEGSDADGSEKEDGSEEEIPEDLNPFDIPSATDDDEGGVESSDDDDDDDEDESSGDEDDWVYYTGALPGGHAGGKSRRKGGKERAKDDVAGSKKRGKTGSGKAMTGFIGSRKGEGGSAFAALEDYEALLDADEAETAAAGPAGGHGRKIPAESGDPWDRGLSKRPKKKRRKGGPEVGSA
jgi:hypothetical protein